MRYLVTGGAGFIGSHLTEALIKQGDAVAVVDDLSTGRYDHLAHLDGHPRFKMVVGSILDERLMDKLMEQCDAVFHLAAAVGVELIIHQPLRSLTTNIRGSEIVLEVCHRYRKKVLITSSSEIYGKNTDVPLHEDQDRLLGSPLKSRWSYSTSKAVDEILAYVYWKEKGVPAIIVRLFNTVGPRQSGAYGMVLPRFVMQALRHEPLKVFGTGEQSRCFLHVADTVSALIKLMGEPKAVGEAINIGSQEEISIRELALRVIRLTGSSSTVQFIPYAEAYGEGFDEMPRRVPDISKVRRLIEFQPAHALDDIIQSVIRYYQSIPSAQWATPLQPS